MALTASIIVPVLNECPFLGDFTAQLEALPAVELIFVDGGSRDDTVQWLEKYCNNRADCHLLHSTRGRALQMNCGAKFAKTKLLWFLHVDSDLSLLSKDDLVGEILSLCRNQNRVWGRFDVQIKSKLSSLKVVAAMMNWRSRMSGIATGDQGIFALSDAFHQVGGYPEQPLMEDIELCKRLKRLSPPICLHHTLGTSGRRWEQQGVLKTIFLMWSLRLQYWLGVSPNRLVKQYYS